MKSSEITEHELQCFEKQKKERHDFRGEMTKLYMNIDEKVNNNTQNINNLKSDNKVFKQITISMNEKIDNLSKLIENLSKDIRENMPSKKEVEENTREINELKKDRFKFIIYLLLSSIGIITTLLTIIFKDKL